MFYHRLEEIKAVKDFLCSEGHGMLVYGRRRVGKTTLINKALEDYKGKLVFFQCTSESYESNCQQFLSEMEVSLGGYWGRFDSFHDIFRLLVSLDMPITVVLDEYNELKESYGSIQTDSMMQKIIDGLKGTKVHIILSGSSISVMKELLESSNPLFGRFHTILKVEDFNYYEASAFFPSWSIRKKAACYSVFGGSPAVLECIDASIPLDENIRHLLLDPRGNARILVENVLLKEFNKLGPVLNILSRIGNGKRTYSELKDVFDPANTGNLSRWLTKLANNDVIVKNAPINGRENSKRAFYSIKDNIFRFYFSYVYPNRSRIEHVGASAVYENFVRPSLETYLSCRFEDVAKEYFSRLACLGKLEGIIDIGSYWYDDRKRHVNGEFDVVLEFLNGYDVFKVKYLKGKMDRLLAEQEAEKIRSIESFKARKIGFVSIDGFDFASSEYVLIDGSMLYEDT